MPPRFSIPIAKCCLVHVRALSFALTLYLITFSLKPQSCVRSSLINPAFLRFSRNVICTWMIIPLPLWAAATHLLLLLLIYTHTIIPHLLITLFWILFITILDTLTSPLRTPCLASPTRNTLIWTSTDFRGVTGPCRGSRTRVASTQGDRDPHPAEGTSLCPHSLTC